MTTQKISSILNKSGFKAFKTYSEKINGKYTRVRTGHFQCFKYGNVMGIETYGIETKKMIEALNLSGINAFETVENSGIIKINL
jgi:hypothetical protein